MGYGFTISIQNSASPAIKGLVNYFVSREFRVAAGEALSDCLRKQLKDDEDKHPNKMGWARQHFFGQAYKHVSNPALVGNDVEVTIDFPGLALLYFGGTVLPIHAHFLAIPAREEAYGHSPRDFNDLRFVPKGPDAGELVQAPSSSRGKSKRSGPTERGGLVFYFLVRSATIKKDPSVLPTQEQIENAVVHGVETLVRHKAAKLGTTSAS